VKTGEKVTVTMFGFVTAGQQWKQIHQTTGLLE